MIIFVVGDKEDKKKILIRNQLQLQNVLFSFCMQVFRFSLFWMHFTTSGSGWNATAIKWLEHTHPLYTHTQNQAQVRQQIEHSVRNILKLRLWKPAKVFRRIKYSIEMTEMCALCICWSENLIIIITCVCLLSRQLTSSPSTRRIHCHCDRNTFKCLLQLIELFIQECQQSICLWRNAFVNEHLETVSHPLLPPFILVLSRFRLPLFLSVCDYLVVSLC